MAADASIYSQYRPIDILGNVKEGMALGQNIQDRRQQTQVAEAYKGAMTQNPDGSVSFDQNKYLGNIMTLGGQGNRYAAQQAMTYDQQMREQNLAKEKYANSLKQQELDNKYRYDALASSAADRAEARAERRYQSGLVRDEKMQALETPYGMANTADDAKQLKQAHESKAAFDSKIQEMIDLRKKYGTEYFNREAVARGQQLSKDALLEYKNMAKLGVLSQSDEAIINAIIPPDPLGNDWAPGQDPILSNLTKFKADSDRDFANRVNTRTRSGLAGRPSDPISTLRKTTELNMSPKSTMQDSAAVKWAKEHPSDPRSAEILKMNGIGG